MWLLYREHLFFERIFKFMPKMINECRLRLRQPLQGYHRQLLGFGISQS